MTDLDLARQMAAAVLDGDAATAYPLADLLSEFRASGAQLAEYCAGKYPRADRYVMAVRAWTESHTGDPSFRKIREEYSDSSAALKRAPADELAALRVLLANEPKDVREQARLGDLWLRWEPGLTVRAAQYLAAARAVTPDEVRRLGRTHFETVGGCGRVTLGSIKAMLARHGLRWN